MLQRLYVNNYRCLENFEIVTKDLSSLLLIGKNGAGKSTVRYAMEILQKISRGTNRANKLISAKDFAHGKKDTPIRFELEVLLDGRSYQYIIAFELPENFREFRVFEEKLTVDGKAIYSREAAQVILHPEKKGRDAKFFVDWHLVALPIIQEQSKSDPIHRFKVWLTNMVIFSPIPCFMTGASTGETLEPELDGTNFGEWFSGILSLYPAAYTTIYEYLKNVMPDIEDIQNKLIGEDTKSMSVQFKNSGSAIRIAFRDLSDGEKCFFICALVLAANKHYGPIFCFWDEPDNYISLSEVGYFITTLRSAFKNGSQIIVTSHNEEAIRRFSSSNTFVLERKTHLEPTRIRILEDMAIQGDIINAMIRGDI
ncbi:MAG: ATP-binding protein [Candidatus Thiothrix moscowensis]|nr:ATP-binding protein [Candidatus Thiothrix moscowensis]